ncbi:MAG TPA: ABC transporter ATP-binding protein [Egicoccus sp.]|nr:ABC transporter ATP-binding protein [Egicoccus sp.]HSK24512.1 ABC transporter ATP-binding protein [Egicoccus sp.]
MLGGDELMLHVEKVNKIYRVGTFGTEELHAVRDVSFDVQRGEVVSLIGESGSGKSTLGKMVLKLISTTSGTIRFDGSDVGELRRSRLREYYRRAQGVFQDPFSSYNPIFKVDRTFDAVRGSYFPGTSDADWDTKIDDALKAVSLNPGDVLGKYPHQLSGGQLQRLLIARALLLDIELLVADEIISMLDASTRIDVLNLLGELKERGLGILFITHDLSLGNYVSDRVVILYRGRVVESGDTEVVFGDPLHPYTRNLLASVPQLDKRWDEVEAAVAARETELSGRCLYHEQVDPAVRDNLAEVAPGHLVGCFAMDVTDPCPITGEVAA